MKVMASVVSLFISNIADNNLGKSKRKNFNYIMYHFILSKMQINKLTWISKIKSYHQNDKELTYKVTFFKMNLRNLKLVIKIWTKSPFAYCECFSKAQKAINFTEKSKKVCYIFCYISKVAKVLYGHNHKLKGGNYFYIWTNDQTFNNLEWEVKSFLVGLQIF